MSTINLTAKPKWRYDGEVNAGYLKIDDGKIVRTISCGGGKFSVVNYDLSECGDVLGIEIYPVTTPPKARRRNTSATPKSGRKAKS